MLEVSAKGGHHPYPFDITVNKVNILPMEETRRKIIAGLTSGEFVLTLHAIERMEERFVSREDIICVGRTLKLCRHQPDTGTYLISGRDLDGHLLRVVCGFELGVIIVTIY